MPRGVRFNEETIAWIYDVHRKAGVSEARVIERVFQIGRQDLAPFEGKALVAVIKEPWEVAQQLPALRRQMEKRGHGRLSSVAGVRLTVADYVALRGFAKNHGTKVSAALRQIVHRILATEAT